MIAGIGATVSTLALGYVAEPGFGFAAGFSRHRGCTAVASDSGGLAADAGNGRHAATDSTPKVLGRMQSASRNGELTSELYKPR